MLQRELLIVMSFVVAVFLAVAGTGWFAVQRLNQTSKQLVLDTLPGLVEAGIAQERMHQERQLMQEMLFPHTAAERAKMIDSVQTNNTDLLWRDYTASIFEPQDGANYQAMLLVRSNYLQTLPQFFGMVNRGNLDQATTYFYGEQQDRFEKYLESVKTVFEYNARQGTGWGQTILNATRYAPWTIGVLCVVVFIFGLALGLRMALRGRV